MTAEREARWLESRHPNVDYLEVAIADPILRQAVAVLDAYHTREDTELAETQAVLADRKRIALAAQDEATANSVWCLEQALIVQNHYLEAWQSMQSDRFYNAWCEMERAEVLLYGLLRHLPARENEFGLQFLFIHIPRWQELFPYRMFFSPAFVKQAIHCSICDARLTPRRSCAHRPGLLYGGEMAGRLIRRAKILEVSLVTNPMQKYSVAWLSDSQYNYALVHYVATGLPSPWHRWDLRRDAQLLSDPRFKDLPDAAPCPCNSGRRFVDCHRERSTADLPHYTILFIDGVREGHSALVIDEPHYGADDQVRERHHDVVGQ